MNDEDQKPPQVLGPYRLGERIAGGGMGEVWRAWDERLHRPVAVKHVLPEILSQPGARERFRREAQAGARLNHPAVVQIYDLVERPDGDWLVMELVSGKTLRDPLRLAGIRGHPPREAGDDDTFRSGRRRIRIGKRVAIGRALRGKRRLTSHSAVVIGREHRRVPERQHMFEDGFVRLRGASPLSPRLEPAA